MIFLKRGNFFTEEDEFYAINCLVIDSVWTVMHNNLKDEPINQEKLFFLERETLKVLNSKISLKKIVDLVGYKTMLLFKISLSGKIFTDSIIIYLKTKKLESINGFFDIKIDNHYFHKI